MTLTLLFLFLFSLLFAEDSLAKRDPRQVYLFKKANPCPSTSKTTGACKGYVVDHIVPLCLDGPDKPSNMQWQEVKASYLKDKLEREACKEKKKDEAKYYQSPNVIGDPAAAGVTVGPGDCLKVTASFTMEKIDCPLECTK